MSWRCRVRGTTWRCMVGHGSCATTRNATCACMLLEQSGGVASYMCLNRLALFVPLNAEEHAREADLAICLGTSLQITPGKQCCCAEECVPRQAVAACNKRLVALCCVGACARCGKTCFGSCLFGATDLASPAPLSYVPACNLPLKATRTYKGGSKEEPGQLVIINLQRTQVGRAAGGTACWIWLAPCWLWLAAGRLWLACHDWLAMAHAPSVAYTGTQS